MNLEEYFTGLADRHRENAEFYGRSLTHWQKFRNWWAKILGKKRPLHPPYKWTPEQLKAIKEKV